MTHLDSQNRIAITKNIREVCNVDFSKEVRIFLSTKGETKYLLLSNNKDLTLPCFGIIHFDSKFRFFLPKELRRYLNLSTRDKFLIYSFNNNLLIEKL